MSKKPKIPDNIIHIDDEIKWRLFFNNPYLLSQKIDKEIKKLDEEIELLQRLEKITNDVMKELKKSML